VQFSVSLKDRLPHPSTLSAQMLLLAVCCDDRPQSLGVECLQLLDSPTKKFNRRPVAPSVAVALGRCWSGVAIWASMTLKLSRQVSMNDQIYPVPFSPLSYSFYRSVGVAGMTDWVTPSTIVAFLLARVIKKAPPRPLPSSLIGVPATSRSKVAFGSKCPIPATL
jgi:hypothetical protein